MSYCRYSSDGWQSDIYAYESCLGGVDVHVAGSRIVFDPAHPYPDHRWTPGKSVEQIMEDCDEQDRAFSFAHREPLDSPYAGMTRNGLTHRAAYEWLLDLREAGLHVPEDALTLLKEDMERED